MEEPHTLVYRVETASSEVKVTILRKSPRCRGKLASQLTAHPPFGVLKGSRCDHKGGKGHHLGAARLKSCWHARDHGDVRHPVSTRACGGAAGAVRTPFTPAGGRRASTCPRLAASPLLPACVLVRNCAEHVQGALDLVLTRLCDWRRGARWCRKLSNVASNDVMCIISPGAFLSGSRAGNCKVDDQASSSLKASQTWKSYSVFLHLEVSGFLEKIVTSSNCG